jgi:uncharacterized membrane protein
MLYLTFKFVHIVAAMIWFGGLVTLALLNMRLARSDDRVLQIAFEKQTEFFGSRVIGAAAGITLLTGFGAMGVGRIGFPFWVIWGIVAMVASMVIGGRFINRAGVERARLLSLPDVELVDLEAARRSIVTLVVINFLILLSAVAVMVFKPVP